MRGLATCVLVGFVAVCAGMGAEPSTRPATQPATQRVVVIDAGVRELVPLIEKGELFFDDIEFAYDYSYRDPQAKDPQMIRAEEQTIQAVNQQGRSALHREDTYETSDGSSSSIETDQRCDGRYRIVCDTKEAIITDYIPRDVTQRSPPPEPFCHFAVHPGRLSQVLKEGLKDEGFVQQHFSRLADALFEGHTCVRVLAVVTQVAPQESREMRYTWWICPDAAYLPVKLDVDVSLPEGRKTFTLIQASDFRPIAPGIVFPFTATSSFGDANVRQWTFDRVVLHPGRPDEYFQELPLRVGMKLMAVHNRKKIKAAPVDADWNCQAAKRLIAEVAATQPATRSTK